MRRHLTPIVRPLCGCGCGRRIPPKTRGQAGRFKRYLNAAHRNRAARHGVVHPDDDLTPAQIEAIFQAAMAQQRYARAVEGTR
jgi:hypothetical protein